MLVIESLGAEFCSIYVTVRSQLLPFANKVLELVHKGSGK